MFDILTETFEGFVVSRLQLWWEGIFGKRKRDCKFLYEYAKSFILYIDCIAGQHFVFDISVLQICDAKVTQGRVFTISKSEVNNHTCL